MAHKLDREIQNFLLAGSMGKKKRRRVIGRDSTEKRSEADRTEEGCSAILYSSLLGIGSFLDEQADSYCKLNWLQRCDRVVCGAGWVEVE